MLFKSLISFALVAYSIAIIPPLNKGIKDKKLSHLMDEGGPMNSKTKYRLPRNTAPRVYMIELDPDFLGEDFTFKGNSTIIFEVLIPTSSITLHRSHLITINEDATQLIHEDGKVEKPIKQTWYSTTEFWTMKFENKLDEGNYTLRMSWTGIDAKNDWFNPFTGFYRAANKDKNGNKSYLVTTHFEPTGARNTFPCWDEPGLKAEFEMSITHPSNYIALSNMPLKNTETMPNGKSISHFERSVKMSPYLPCVLVADYKSIKNKEGNITFYAIESDLEYMDYALEMSEKAIPAMEAYTGVPYALSKLDQITVPKYSAIAMEHWGLVSYLTASVKLKNSTLIPNVWDKDQIAFIVAHELAHQWFGNLVSPVWWDDLWLNEAFAAYFQYKTVDQMFPHWRTMDFYVVENVNENAYDAEYMLMMPRAIKHFPRTKVDIEMMFSPVTYEKGGAIVHMMEHILSKEVFDEGITNYLKKHQFSAVITNDLWESLQQAWDKKFPDKKLDIKNTMDPWIEQTGYPILSVTRDNATNDVVVTVEKGGFATPEDTWRIPINYATKSNPDFSSTAPTMWIEEDQKEIRIPNIPRDDWIILNIQQRGFYKVKYDMENWHNLIDYLHSDDFKKIHPVNRAQLVTDILDMYKENNAMIDLLISMTLYLHQERDYLVWLPASKIMYRFVEELRNTPAEEMFEIYVLIVTSEITEHLGFEHREGDEHAAVKLRTILAPLICAVEHADCNAYGKKMFNEYMKNPSENAFPSTDWDWILCDGLWATKDEKIWDDFLSGKLPLPEHINETRYTFITCLESEETRNKYIAKLMEDSSTVHPDQITEMFQDFFESTKDDVDYAMDYVIKHFEEIKKYYKKYEDSDILVLIGRMGLGVNSEEQLAKFKKFLEPNLQKLKEEYQTSSSIISSIILMDDEDYGLETTKEKYTAFEETMRKYIEAAALEAGKELQKPKEEKA